MPGLEKNLSEQRREPTTNSTHIWHHHQDMNMAHIGGGGLGGVSVLKGLAKSHGFNFRGP